MKYTKGIGFAFDIREGKLDEIVQINRSHIDKLEKLNKSMYLVLREVMADNYRIGNTSPITLDKINALLKQIDS